MSPRLHLFACFCAALWFGSMSVTGFMAVPTIFANLQPVAAAGAVAAKLFAKQGWLSITCAVLLLVCFRGRLRNFAQQQYDENGQPLGRDTSQPPNMLFFSAVVMGLLLVLVLQFGVAPRIEMRQNLGFWHPLGVTLYSLQWLCAATALWRLAMRKI